MDSKTTSEKIRELFKQKGDLFPCTVGEGCSYAPSSLNISNCTRHSKEQHPLEYNVLGIGKRLSDEEVQQFLKRKRIKTTTPDDSSSVRLCKQKVVGGLIKLVTLHSCPFACLSWEGLRDIIDPILEAFQVTVNRANIPEFVSKTCQAIDAVIQTEANNQMLSFKFDCTTKMNRSVMGISMQYYKDLQLMSRCLGVIELTDRHTGAYLKSEIINVAAKFGVKPWQFYSATIDNAKNGVKCVDEIAAVQEEEIIKEFFTDAATDDDEDEYDPLFEDPKVALCESALEVCFVECIRCGSHTLNLVVNDATKLHESELKEITGIVKSYRKAEYINRFKNTGVALPPIPVKTRWNHYFLMTRSLNKNHDFFNGLGIKYPELDLSEKWQLIEEYNEAFEPLYYATINSQALECPISNFHLEWLKAIGRVMKIGNNRFKQPILDSMEKRQKLMMSSLAYKAALYMDPRFSFNGSELFHGPEKEEIVDFLVKLWRKIKTHDGGAQPPVAPQAPVAPEAEPAEIASFDVDNFFTQMFGQGSNKAGTSEDKLKKKLTNIQFQNRVLASDTNFNVIHYYFSNRCEDEQLWKIAKVVYAAAATQAEVEREFTQFNNVYTSLRNRLSGKNTDNILKVKLNQDLLPSAIPAALGIDSLPQAS